MVVHMQQLAQIAADVGRRSRLALLRCGERAAVNGGTPADVDVAGNTLLSIAA